MKTKFGTVAPLELCGKGEEARTPTTDFHINALHGGNQRELARAKNMKKTVKKAAAEQESNKGLSLEQRKARDAERMREKQLKKQQEQQEKTKQAAR
ncbi:hypothetical protein HZH66_009405 [Vespula vulgaris]|uniref:Small EDRK-rich factor-like N-terminal domain-containing protein n=1 Tax=Vespula vulgaris TaxID=7454 RepID=A0A834JMX2_VESVU|nr:hypothetical protein HZH66_009405 [Vespula vulgaris]